MKTIKTIAEVGLFAPDGSSVGVVKRVEFKEVINVQDGEDVRLIRDEAGKVIGAEKCKEAVIGRCDECGELLGAGYHYSGSGRRVCAKCVEDE